MMTLWDLLSPVMRLFGAPVATPTRPRPPREGPRSRPSSSTRARKPRRPAGPAPQPTLFARKPLAPVPSAPAPADPRAPLLRRPAARVVPSGATGVEPNRTPLGPGVLARPRSARERYDALIQHELAAHRIRVRRWRTAMSGVAWTVTYKDGSVVRLIESPRPKGPMSAAIFLHEVGHHAIGFDVYKPRCLEEFHAWRWSLEAMERHGIEVTEAVKHRQSLSLWYAVDKAKRRGLRVLPVELEPFQVRPPKRSRQGRGEA